MNIASILRAEGFTRRPLGEFVQFLDSQRVPIKASERKPGPYPYFGANGLQDHVDGYIFDEKLVLLAEDGGNFDDPSRPISYLVEGKCWVNNHAHVLRALPALVPEYLNYQLAYANVSAFLSGSTRPKLTKSDAMRISIVVPPVGVQHRIVDVLSRSENIVRMRRDAEQKAKDIIPALFLDIFGDPATNSKGWEVQTLAELGTLDRGRSRHRPRDAPHLYGGKHPFVQTGDVTRSGGVITTYEQTYTDAGLAQSKQWPAGTLCITIAANIAESGILTFDSCFPDSVVGFSPGSRVRTDYIQQWLGFLQPTLAAQAPQAAQKNINLAILRRLKVPVPPLEPQDAFADRVQSIRAIQSSQRNAIASADQVFHSLLARLFQR
jgi:type I restriction enzyme S subunit